MKWYRIESKADDRAEIWIYEQIGEDFWTGGGVTAKSFQKDLSVVKAKQIDLHINSPGGSVFDGITIHNLIKDHPAQVTTYIDGLAASIASVIALSGDHIVMAENALWMMHNPSGMAYGTSDDLRSTADVLDKVAGSMINSYVSRSGSDESKIRSWLDAETWMDAHEAKAAGFVDEISGEMDMAACSRFLPVMAKMRYKHAHEKLNALGEKPSERELERILRDAGCSRKLAKAILAEGYPGTLRDADETEIPEQPKTQREAAPVGPSNMDRVSRLLTQAEIIAPASKLILRNSQG